MKALRLLVQTAAALALVLLVPLAAAAFLLCVLFGLAGAACGHLARLVTRPHARPLPSAEPIVPEAVLGFVRRRRLKPPEQPGE